MTNSADTGLQNFHSGAIQALAHVAVASLLFIGVLFLYEGLGVDFRILDYAALKPYGITIGLFLLCSSMVTARLWIFERDLNFQGRGRATTPPGSFAGAASPMQRGPYSTTPVNDNRTPDVASPSRATIGKDDPSISEPYRHVLDPYDATALVGVHTIVHNGAIESIERGGSGVRIDIPNLDELRAGAAVLRCLLPIKLRGREIRAIRTIARLAPSDLLRGWAETTDPNLLLQWESENQSMDEVTEKTLRQRVCATVGPKAAHVHYDASTIEGFKIVDPWKCDPSYQVPPVILNWVPVKEGTDSASGAWNDEWAA